MSPWRHQFGQLAPEFRPAEDPMTASSGQLSPSFAASSIQKLPQCNDPLLQVFPQVDVGPFPQLELLSGTLPACCVSFDVTSRFQIDLQQTSSARESLGCDVSRAVNCRDAPS